MTRPQEHAVCNGIRAVPGVHTVSEFLPYLEK